MPRSGNQPMAGYLTGLILFFISADIIHYFAVVNKAFPEITTGQSPKTKIFPQRRSILIFSL